MDLKKGNRVKHANSKEQFGDGTVLSVNAKEGTALIEWNTHQVERSSPNLTRQQTHVNVANLIRIDDSR